MSPFFQLARAFRDGEAGGRHNPEFTLLEVSAGFDHHALMAEVAELVRHCLGDRPCTAIAIASCSARYWHWTLHRIDYRTGSPGARQLRPGSMTGDRDLWLDLLMSHLIEPQLAGRGMCFVYDYPASRRLWRASLRSMVFPVGHRFELYVDGMELANGYLELLDTAEQRQRFESDNARRREVGLPERALDEHLLAALDHGMPSCSGVALGVDRLLMLATGVEDIREVLAFDWDRA